MQEVEVLRMYVPSNKYSTPQEKKNKDIHVGYKLATLDKGSKEVLWEDYIIPWWDVEETFRIAIIAPSGTGKTFLIRLLADMYNKIRGRVIYINDLKGDMRSSRYPNYDMFKQLKRGLPRKVRPKFPLDDLRLGLERMGHTPTAMEDLKIFAPEFGRKVKDTIPFSFKFSSLDEPILRSILDIKAYSSGQRRYLSYMMDVSRKFKKRGKDVITKEIIDQFKDEIPEMMEKAGSLKDAERIKKDESIVKIFEKLMLVKKNKILDGPNAMSIEEVLSLASGSSLRRGEIPNISFDWSGITWANQQDAQGAYQAYIAAIIFGVTDLKIRGKIKPPICLIGDELQDVLKRKAILKYSPIREALHSVFIRGRAFDISAIIALQYGKDLDPAFVSNATHVFIGRETDSSQRRKYREILSSAVGGYSKDVEKAAEMHDSLNKNEFLAFDVVNSDVVKIKAYPPLSLHKTKLNT